MADQLRSLGGELHTGQAVEKINVQDGKVTGVRVGGQDVPADVVVASGGAEETFVNMVGEAALPQGWLPKVKATPLMDSVYMIHLGVDMDPRPALAGTCTYFYNTYDLDAAIDRAHAGIFHEGREGYVIHLPSHHSPGMAEPGCHAMTIYTIAPDRLAEGTWAEKEPGFTDTFLACVEERIPGLRKHIRTQLVMTPDDFRKISYTRHHAFGGIAPVMGAWRPPHRTPVQGLWFVGHQSESGGGVGTVITTANKTALKILS